MGVTNETWGLVATTDIVKAYIGQYAIDAANYPVDTSRIDYLIQHACAHINGIIIGLDYDLATVAADTDSVAYMLIQGCAAKMTAAYALRSSQGKEQELAKSLIEECEAHLAKILSNPALLGEDSAGEPATVWTTTQGLGLSTTEASRAKRRVFDDVRERTSEADDRHYW